MCIPLGTSVVWFLSLEVIALKLPFYKSCVCTIFSTLLNGIGAG